MEPCTLILRKYKLLSIVINWEIRVNAFHLTSIIKCKDGWYYFDNNLAQDGRSMIKLKVKIEGADIDFLPFTYSYYQLDDNEENLKKKINFDLLKIANGLNFIYCM